MDEEKQINKTKKCPEVAQCGSVVCTVASQHKGAWAQLPAQRPFLCVLLNFPLDSPDFTQCMLGDTPASCNPEEEYPGEENGW